MNDIDFEKKLKAARVPEREEDYWESFPRVVLARLRAAPAARPEIEHGRLSKLAWGGVAFACLVIGFAIGHSPGRVEKNDPYALLQNQKVLREVLTLFPNRVRAIVQDERGEELVLSDQPDVPASTPLWIKICDGTHCRAVVTFSGQELQIGEKKVTVLSDARGGIILMGNDFAWSSDEPAYAKNDLKIEAKPLVIVL
jgi:hypothetical protein